MPGKAAEGVSGALQDAGGTAQSVVKTAGHAIGTAADKAKGPALAVGAAAAAIGGGIALSKSGKLNMRRHKRFLGVPMPQRTLFGNLAKQVGDAVDAAGSAGKQVSALSDGLQELRKTISGDGGSSPVEKLTQR
jgi:hypothetical protein